MGGGLFGCALSVLVARAVALVAMMLSLQGMAPKALGLGWRAGDVRALLVPTLAFQTAALTAQAQVQGPILIFAALFGPEATALFGTLRTLARLGPMFLGYVTEVARPKIAQAFARHCDGALARLLARLVQVMVPVGLVWVGAVIVIGPSLHRLWTLERLSVVGGWLIAPIALSALAQSWLGQINVVLASLDRQVLAAPLQALATALGLALAYGIGASFGLGAALFALVLGDWAAFAMGLGALAGTQALDRNRLGHEILRRPTWLGPLIGRTLGLGG